MLLGTKRPSSRRLARLRRFTAAASSFTCQTTAAAVAVAVAVADTSSTASDGKIRHSLSGKGLAGPQGAATATPTSAGYQCGLEIWA